MRPEGGAFIGGVVWVCSRWFGCGQVDWADEREVWAAASWAVICYIVSFVFVFSVFFLQRESIQE